MTKNEFPAQRKIKAIMVDGWKIPAENLRLPDEDDFDTTAGMFDVTLLAHQKFEIIYEEGWINRGNSEG